MKSGSALTGGLGPRPGVPSLIIYGRNPPPGVSVGRGPDLLPATPRFTIRAAMNRAKSPAPTASMTAFARREAATPWGALTWELRSVNHRYLEIALRLPEELGARG